MAAALTIPPPPDGFELDSPSVGIPPPPDGFELDTPAPSAIPAPPEGFVLDEPGTTPAGHPDRAAEAASPRELPYATAEESSQHLEILQAGQEALFGPTSIVGANLAALNAQRQKEQQSQTFTTDQDGREVKSFEELGPFETIGGVGKAQYERAKKAGFKTGTLAENVMTPAFEPLHAPTASELREKYPDLPEGSERPVAIMEGVVSDFGNFFTSPLGVATLGLGAAPKAIHKLVAGAFATHAATHAPETFSAIQNAKTPEEKDLAIRAAIGQGLVLLGGTKAALGREPIGAAERAASMERVTDAKLAELQRQIQNEPTKPFNAGAAEPTTTKPPTALDATPAPLPPAERIAEPAGKDARTPAGEAPVVEGEPAPVGGPGAMGPVEAKEMRDANAVTGVKNAQVEAERIMRGEEPLTKEEPLPNRQAIAEGVRAIEQDPSRPDVIIEGINSSTRDARSISVADQAVLMAHKVDLMKQRLAQEDILADGNRAPEEHIVANQKLTELEQKMNAVDQATESMGTEGGRFLQLRQRLLRQDYSLEALERKARIAKDDALTPAESAKIKEQSTRIAELETQLEAVQKSAAEKHATSALDETVSALKKQAEQSASPETKFAPRVIALAESIVSRLDTAADAARARIRERLTGKMQQATDPLTSSAVHIYDIAVIGVSKLARASLDFVKWSAEMKADLGDWVEPHLAEAWKKADELWKGEEKKVSAPDRPAINRVRAKNLTDAEKQAATTNAIKEAAARGDKPEELRSIVQKLALDFVRKGVTDREALVDSVHGVLKEAYPDLAREPARDLISGYGEFKALDKEAAKVTLRGLKGEMQQLGKIEDLQAKQAPRKTGMERRSPTDEERRLIKEVNELKKKGGFEVTDPETQLKTAMEAVKTRLRNEIRDLDNALLSQERIPGKKSSLEYDAEANALKEQRDAKKAQYDEMFPKEPLTNEQKIYRASKSLDRSIEQLEKDLKAGKLYGDKPAKMSAPELEAKRARLAALQQERQLLRDIDNPKKTKEEIALQAYKTRTANRIAELEQRIAWNDFSKAPKRELAMDKAAMDLKAKIQGVRNEFNMRLKEMELARRPFWQKALSQAGQIRGVILGSDIGVLTRQGLFAWSRPVTAIKATLNALKAGFSKEAMGRWEVEVRDREINGKRAEPIRKEAGLQMTDTMMHPEELVITRLLSRIPDINVGGRTIRLSEFGKTLERFQTTFINSVRADLLDAGIKQGMSMPELKLRANFINSVTGRSNMKYVPGALQAIMTSPRYEVSRWETLAQPVRNLGALARSGVKGELNKAALANLRDIAVTAGGILALYMIAQKAGGYQVNWDPTSTDFLKMRKGNEVWDVSAGLAPRLRDVMRLYVAFTHPDYKHNLGKVLLNMGLRTINPTITTTVNQSSLALQKARGEKKPKMPFNGFTSDDERNGLITLAPLIVQSTKEALEKEGIGAAAWTAVREFVGSSVNRYPEAKK